MVGKLARWFESNTLRKKKQTNNQLTISVKHHIFINSNSYLNINQKNKKMKKIFALLSIVALTACGGEGTSTEVTTDSSTVVVDSSAVIVDSSVVEVEEVK